MYIFINNNKCKITNKEVSIDTLNKKYKTFTITIEYILNNLKGWICIESYQIIDNLENDTFICSEDNYVMEYCYKDFNCINLDNTKIEFGKIIDNTIECKFIVNEDDIKIKFNDKLDIINKY